MNGMESAFRRAMAEHSPDNGVRLIFADWLDEQGRHIEAASFRVQPIAALPGVTFWRSGHRPYSDGGDGSYGGYGGYGG